MGTIHLDNVHPLVLIFGSLACFGGVILGLLALAGGGGSRGERMAKRPRYRYQCQICSSDTRLYMSRPVYCPNCGNAGDNLMVVPHEE